MAVERTELRRTNKTKNSSEGKRKGNELNKGQLRGTVYHPTNRLTLVYQLHPCTCPPAGIDPRRHLHSRSVPSRIQIPSAWGDESAEVHFPKQMGLPQKKKESVSLATRA